MNIEELAALIADHGELYEPDWYHGCDCGYKCSANEYPEHLATVVQAAMGRCFGLTDAERETLRDCVTDLPPDEGPPYLFAAVESIKGDAYSAGLAAAYLTAPSCEAKGMCRAHAALAPTAAEAYDRAIADVTAGLPWDHTADRYPNPYRRSDG